MSCRRHGIGCKNSNLSIVGGYDHDLDHVGARQTYEFGSNLGFSIWNCCFHIDANANENTLTHLDMSGREVFLQFGRWDFWGTNICKHAQTTNKLASRTTSRSSAKLLARVDLNEDVRQNCAGSSCGAVLKRLKPAASSDSFKVRHQVTRRHLTLWAPELSLFLFHLSTHFLHFFLNASAVSAAKACATKWTQQSSVAKLQSEKRMLSLHPFLVGVHTFVTHLLDATTCYKEKVFVLSLLMKIERSPLGSKPLRTVASVASSNSHQVHCFRMFGFAGVLFFTPSLLGFAGQTGWLTSTIIMYLYISIYVYLIYIYLFK